MAVPGSYNLKWNAHNGHLNSYVGMLYRSSAFTDVVLATTDGLYVSAHQFILSAYSKYFHNVIMVGGNSSNTNAKLVVVLPPQIGHSTLNILLEYIYKGEAVVNEEQLPGIMKAAELLQIRGLYPSKCIRDTKSTHILKNILGCSEGTSTSITSKPEMVSEARYNSECTSMSASSTSPSSNSTLSRQTSPNISSPIRKKQKVCATESVKVNKKINDAIPIEEDIMVEKIIVGKKIRVKKEPESSDDQKSLENNIDIKEETIAIKSEDEDVEIEADEDGYVPLTCDLCHKTFSSPALWVRHIETEHPTTALASGKQSKVDDDGSKEFPPLECEYCQEVFSVPAEWVRHTKAHTEQQASQDSVDEISDSSSSTQTTRKRIVCTVCGKMLQSSASMQIHLRTHTGERPYLCKLCGREFNVKSNYVRHMRTLHEQIDNNVINAPKSQ